jgi:transcriptional antiterminator
MTNKQLTVNIKRKKSFLCVGLDTDPRKLPTHLTSEMTEFEAMLAFKADFQMIRDQNGQQLFERVLLQSSKWGNAGNTIEVCQKRRSKYNSKCNFFYNRNR